MSDTVHTHGGSDHLYHDGCLGCESERGPLLTTRHTITIEIDVDHERVSYSALPEQVDDWTPRDVEDALTGGHAHVVRDGNMSVD